jgi:hypothetical protein
MEDYAEFDEETKDLIRLVDRDRVHEVLQQESRRRKACVLEQFDPKQDPHALAQRLYKTLTQCTHLLTSHPYEVLQDEMADEAEACRRLWYECFFDPAHSRVEKGRFSLSDWTWITWCHMHVVSEESPRVWGALLLKQDVSYLQHLHALVKMVIREFSDFASLWPQSKLSALEDRCAGIVVLGKEMVPDAEHEMRELTRLSDKIIMTSPLVMDEQTMRLMATNDWEHPAEQTVDWSSKEAEEKMQKKMATLKKTRQQQKEQGMNAMDDETAFISVRSAMDNLIDMDKEFHDHRQPENRGQVQLYMPDVFDFGDFVVDSARLFHWTSVYFSFLARHQDRIRPARELSAELMTDYAQEQIYKRLSHRATLQISSDAESLAADLYYKSRVPMGARDAYSRNNLVEREALGALTLIQVEMGDKAGKKLSEEKEHRSHLVLPSALPEPGKRHRMFAEWAWVLWGRLMSEVQISWLKNYMILLDDLPLRMQDTEIHQFNLNLAQPWPTLIRRPLVLWLGGEYFVQAVCEVDAEKMELWRCGDVLEAINCWLALMLLRFDCVLLDGSDLKHKFHKFLLDPHLTVREYVEDIDEEALQMALEDFD